MKVDFEKIVVSGTTFTLIRDGVMVGDVLLSAAKLLGYSLAIPIPGDKRVYRTEGALPPHITDVITDTGRVVKNGAETAVTVHANVFWVRDRMYVFRDGIVHDIVKDTGPMIRPQPPRWQNHNPAGEHYFRNDQVPQLGSGCNRCQACGAFNPNNV